MCLLQCDGFVCIQGHPARPMRTILISGLSYRQCLVSRLGKRRRFHLTYLKRTTRLAQIPSRVVMYYSRRAVQSPFVWMGVPTSLLFVPSLLFAHFAFGQDVGKQDNERLGNGSVITVMLHDTSGGSFLSSAVVKLFYGITPNGQRDTTRGVAEFVVTRFGNFTVVVSAPGYAEAQKTSRLTSLGGHKLISIFANPRLPQAPPRFPVDQCSRRKRSRRSIRGFGL